ncbi:MAG TPA: hypothetical protein VFE48_18550 [Methylomirabilota bacterium]|nr:hypothetical protein [Methylomirabilota bacterium]
MHPRLAFSPVAAMVPTGLLFMVLLAAAALFAADTARVVAYPYPMDYGEGPLLEQTLRLGRLDNIYRADLTSPPYTVSNYPPLYPAVLSPLARTLGPALWYGRLLSALSMVAAAIFVGLILTTLTGDRIAAVAGGLFLLAFPPVSYWGALYRVDALALALSLAGVWVVVRWPDARSAVPTAALLLVAAIYTRQSYGMAAPLAAAVWTARAASWRRALGLIGLTGALGAALFVALEIATGGGFSFNIVAANWNAYEVGSLLQYGTDLWTLMPLTLAAAAAFVLVAPCCRVASWWLVAPYLIAAALSGATIGKVGSNVNYLIELGAGLALALGALIAWVRPRRVIHAALVMLLAADLVLVVLASPYRTVVHVRLKQREQARRLLDVVHRAPGVVLADEDMGLLPLDGRPIFLQPFEMAQLARAGRWNQRPLLEALERRAFAAILIYRAPGLPLERQRWTDQMLQVIDRRYVSDERIGLTEIYRPRPGG